jgi:hypothetical protein
MSFFRNMFGMSRTRASGPPTSSQMHSQISSGMSQQLAQSQNTTRRELLRVVLRDTLNRHGIPTSWIAAELVTTTSRSGERGIHWRLMVKHWDPRLLEHTVALQNALVKRVLTFDPLAVNWLNGISWQIALEDESVCPALPPPPTWTLNHRAATAPQGPSGDVIEGPVRIGADAAQSDVKAELDELLKIRDEDFRRHSADGTVTPRTYAKTEPAKL